MTSLGPSPKPPPAWIDPLSVSRTGEGLVLEAVYTPDEVWGRDQVMIPYLGTLLYSVGYWVLPVEEERLLLKEQTS